jgi:hypothetical protein
MVRDAIPDRDNHRSNVLCRGGTALIPDRADLAGLRS